MSDKTDHGYDEATRKADGQHVIPGAHEIDPRKSRDEPTEDNALDDAHSVDDIEEALEPAPPDAKEANEVDNSAEWSREE